MKNSILVLSAACVAIGLTACNSGSSSSSSSSDIQENYVTLYDEVTGESLTVGYLAAGCYNIESNGGSCSLTLGYVGDNEFAGESIGLSGLGSSYTTTPNISSCPLVSESDTECSLTITSTGSVNTPTIVQILLNGTTELQESFIVGGGFPTSTLIQTRSK